MIKKYLFTILLIFLFALTAMSFSGRVEGEVVCFGDSITRGALVNGHSWVYFLSAKHKNLNFINEGRNGRKTTDKEEILPVIKKHRDADYFLIFLGVNDLKNGNAEAVKQCVQNIKWMTAKIKEANPKTKIVILSPCDINLKTMSELNIKKKYNENTKSSLVLLEEEYKKLAKENSLGFITLLHRVSPQNYVDGLHPNRKGQMQIAAAVWKALKSLYN